MLYTTEITLPATMALPPVGGVIPRRGRFFRPEERVDSYGLRMVLSHPGIVVSLPLRFIFQRSTEAISELL